MKRTMFLLLICCMVFSCNKLNKEKGAKAFYEGDDISDVARITRDKNTKTATFVINTGGKWVLYGGRSVENIDFSEPLEGGFEAGRFKLNIPDSVRMYFQLITDNGRTILSETRLPMEGGYNFRDIGGIRNKDGRYVKWGKLIRSDEMNNLTGSDLNYLSNIPLISLVDFRSEQEIENAPDRLPESVKNPYQLSISPGNLSNVSAIMEFSEKEAEDFMLQMYDSLVSDSAVINRYREFFAILQDVKNIPLLYHCTAGKDRTGVATALILYALNVDENTIMDNYLDSNLYLQNKYKELGEERPNLKPLFEVKEEYLGKSIESIKKTHKTVENYLVEVLNVDPDKFKEIYLY